MGHVRLGVLPASKKWAEVVRLLEDGANVPELANAVAVAAENEIIAARGDPTLASTVWLLTQLPLAARSDRYAAELAALGFPQGSDASLVNIVAGFSAAVTNQQSSASRRTDLGVLAQQAAAETLSTLVGARMPSLFGISAEDVRIDEALVKGAVGAQPSDVVTEISAVDSVLGADLDEGSSNEDPAVVLGNDRLDGVTTVGGGNPGVRKGLVGRPVGVEA